MNKLLLCLVVSSITCCLCASVRNSNSSRHSGRRQRNGQSKVKEFRCRFVEQLDNEATDCQMFRKARGNCGRDKEVFESLSKQRYFGRISKPKCVMDVYLHECRFYAKVAIKYKAITKEDKFTGFYIQTMGSHGENHCFGASVPADYDQTKGGKFTIDLRDVDHFSGLTPEQIFYFQFRASPKSRACRAAAWIPGCLDQEIITSTGCDFFPECSTYKNATQKDIDIYRRQEDKNASSIDHSSIEQQLKLLFISILSILMFILFFVACMFKARRRSSEFKRRAVVLISTGDISSRAANSADKLALELKQSGRYEDVYFNGWLGAAELSRNLELMVDALFNATVVVFFTSPFGAKAYLSFVREKQEATWKDEFVIAAYSLFRKDRSNMMTAYNRKILVVHHGNQNSLPGDFVRYSHDVFNLSRDKEAKKFYKELETPFQSKHFVKAQRKRRFRSLSSSDS